jgi:hypothetical protein
VSQTIKSGTGLDNLNLIKSSSPEVLSSDHKDAEKLAIPFIEISSLPIFEEYK